MGGFGSRGGLLRNAPLKRGSCTDKDAQSRPELRPLDKAVSEVCLEIFGQAAADGFTEKSFCRTGENR